MRAHRPAFTALAISTTEYFSESGPGTTGAIRTAGGIIAITVMADRLRRIGVDIQDMAANRPAIIRRRITVAAESRRIMAGAGNRPVAAHLRVVAVVSPPAVVAAASLPAVVAAVSLPAGVAAVGLPAVAAVGLPAVAAANPRVSRLSQLQH